MTEVSEDQLLRVRIALAARRVEDAEKVRKYIEDLGLGAVHASRRGVEFEASKQNIEQRLRTRIDRNDFGNLVVAAPDFPDDIKKRVRSVYLPSKPEFF